jgi:hypothetical protein
MESSYLFHLDFILSFHCIRFWNSLPNDIGNDFHCIKCYLSSLQYSFGLLVGNNTNTTVLSKREIQSSGMVGVVAMGMRLLERYDTQSHLLGIDFLMKCLKYITGSQLIHFIEWILPQFFVNFK